MYPVIDITPETTKQQLFDAVVNHLLTQRERASGLSLGCLYRTDTGLACAVGCLVTDDEAHDMDNNMHGTQPTTTLSSLVDDRKLPERLLPFVDLLDRLQRIHDSYGIDEWRQRLLELATDQGLAFNSPLK